VGGIVGFTIVSKGTGCVIWNINGVGGIVISWFTSPVTSALIAIITYKLVHHFILTAQNPVKRGLIMLPFLFAVVVAFLLIMILWKSPATKGFQLWVSILIALGCGFISGILCQFLFLPWLKQKLNIGDEEVLPLTKHAITPKFIPDENSSATLINTKAEKSNTDQALYPDSKTEVKTMEQQTQHLFLHLQIMTAALMSFAHGANDVANAIGPLAAIWFLWTAGAVNKQQTPYWMLAFGGVSIVLGLAVLGHKVIGTIGKKITHVNFPRGFSMEFATAISVVIASRIGMPISTTHCQVGSVVGVGLITRNEADQKPLNWRLFLGIVLSWFVTVPISGCVSALFMWCMTPSVQA